MHRITFGRDASSTLAATAAPATLSAPHKAHWAFMIEWWPIILNSPDNPPEKRVALYESESNSLRQAA
jgi:hypothetical protein